MTINDLITQVNRLSKVQSYAFRNKSNHNTFMYVGRLGQSLKFLRIQDEKKTDVTVSERNLQKIVNKVRAYVPFQIDVIVGASGNWRSLFESALAYTPQFYLCMKDGQRHLIWAPQYPHKPNVLTSATAENLVAFNKCSRLNDFEFFMENCYPISGCYDDFRNALGELLRIIRLYDFSIKSVFDIGDAAYFNELINKMDSGSHSELQKPMSNNHNFSLYDAAKAYLMFLNAKDYFAFY